jgi:hypothetical protein
MRKYVITNATGHTPSGVKLEPGKYIQNPRSKENLMVRLSDCSGDTPLVAALLSPVAASKAKMFAVNCWNVAVDPAQPQSYTVVKEVAPVPEVHLEQKLWFAIAIMRAVYKNGDFRRWADKWLSGEDRGAASAQTLRHAIEKELEAGSDLDALTAWGETGGDDERIVHKLDALAQRVMHVLQAVDLAGAHPPKEDKAALEIAVALAHVDEFGKRVDLASFAEQAVSGMVPVVAPLSKSAAG